MSTRSEHTRGASRWKTIQILSVISALGLLSISTGASAKSCLVRVLKDMVSEVSAPFLGEADLRRVSAIFSEKSLTREQKARQAFESVLEARLRSVPDKDADIIRNTYKSIETKHSKGEVNGTYLAIGNGALEVTVPEAYAGTMVEYFIITHELEHALQHLRTKGKIGPINVAIQQVTRATSSLFLKEEGAMRAEWAYLNSIPESDRSEIALEITRDTTIKSLDKDFVVRNLLAAGNPADVYLKVQRHAGRYSKSNIAMTTIPLQAGFYASTSIAGMFITLSVVSSTCIGRIDKWGNFPDSKFFSKVCLKLTPVVNEIIHRRSKEAP